MSSNEFVSINVVTFDNLDGQWCRFAVEPCLVAFVLCQLWQTVQNGFKIPQATQYYNGSSINIPKVFQFDFHFCCILLTLGKLTTHLVIRDKNHPLAKHGPTKLFQQRWERKSCNSIVMIAIRH